MRRRRILVPLLSALLGLFVVATIVVLQQRADQARHAQLELAALNLEQTALQTVPFRAIAASGGSPEIAAELLRSGKQRINSTLARLRQNDPPQALHDLQGPLVANYTVLDRIYRIGVETGTYGAEADRLAGIAIGKRAETRLLLEEAGAAYEGRATRAARQATAGAGLAIALLLCAFALLYRKSDRLRESSEHDALHDALTGLGNRRALVRDLSSGLARASAAQPLLLGLFDLDGFKQYNDTFGHPAGDALLARLGERLQESVRGTATAYRMGGDEFCLLGRIDGPLRTELMSRAAAALSETGETFRISCSHGTALLPMEASSPDAALHIADQRMYAQKAGVTPASRQISDVLLTVLSERSCGLDAHVSSVGRFARMIAQQLQLAPSEQDRIELAAELHDVGKTAIPDSLLNKPGALSDEEWEYVRRHTVIGERILLAAPSLTQTASLVRSSHERVDGAGYPDGLQGDEIPIGSRIIAVCDAYDAMTSDRTYRAAMPAAEALAELDRHAGTQFDPQIVAAFHLLASELMLAEGGAIAA